MCAATSVRIMIKEFKIQNTKYKNLKGFTLIELLVVIAIIGVLAAVGLASYQNAQKVARDGKRKADLKQVQSALEMYRADKNAYPTPAAGNITNLSGDLVDDYIGSLPRDPTVSNYYYYYSGGASYYLCAKLENTHDPDIINSPCGAESASCGSSEVCNYGVRNP